MNLNRENLDWVQVTVYLETGVPPCLDLTEELTFLVIRHRTK